MIRTSTYPTIFKLSRITPLCKMNKNPLLPSSYRPINNLPCLEKIFEQYMLDCLLPFLNENEIIDINQHGGLKGHSTMTAMTSITHNLQKNWDNDLITATLTTDLTAAYDTVDSEILLQKLEFYGIRGNELNLFKSYLKGRYQFVQIDTFNSYIKESLDCSIIKGSKLSGILYVPLETKYKIR